MTKGHIGVTEIGENVPAVGKTGVDDITTRVGLVNILRIVSYCSNNIMVHWFWWKGNGNFNIRFLHFSRQYNFIIA